jgi:hypothetical protein
MIGSAGPLYSNLQDRHVKAVLTLNDENRPVSPEPVQESRSRKSAQGDKWSFCLTAGTLCPANQERR